MSQTLRIELSDEVYAALQQHAEATGTSPSDLVATTLALQYSAPSSSAKDGRQQTEAEKQAARERFERHFGAVNLGYATGAANEDIDADLADEYADNHEKS
jgi:predicted transcriptional regulator